MAPAALDSLGGSVEGKRQARREPRAKREHEAASVDRPPRTCQSVGGRGWCRGGPIITADTWQTLFHSAAASSRACFAPFFPGGRSGSRRSTPCSAPPHSASPGSRLGVGRSSCWTKTWKSFFSLNHACSATSFRLGSCRSPWTTSRFPRSVQPAHELPGRVLVLGLGGHAIHGARTTFRRCSPRHGRDVELQVGVHLSLDGDPEGTLEHHGDVAGQSWPASLSRRWKGCRVPTLCGRS